MVKISITELINAADVNAKLIRQYLSTGAKAYRCELRQLIVERGDMYGGDLSLDFALEDLLRTGVVVKQAEDRGVFSYRLAGT